MQNLPWVPTLSPRNASRGYSLFEVLVALLLVSVALLGFAASLGVTVRSGQSANHRTQATNLAYSIIDAMRANRNSMPEYATTFAQATVTGSTTAKTDLNAWKGALSRALPGGQGEITFTGNTQVNVSIQWTDQRWSATAAEQQLTFQVTSRL